MDASSSMKTMLRAQHLPIRQGLRSSRPFTVRNLQPQHINSSRRSLCRANVKQEVTTNDSADSEPAGDAENNFTSGPEPGADSDAGKQEVQSLKDGETIYLGFDKGDLDPREGRKGRVIKDDPTRYPDRSPFVGGWAGGEKGLQQFIQDVEASDLSREDKDKLEEAAQSGPGTKKIMIQGREITARVVGDGGKDPIYIGFDKKELAKKKAGGPGTFIVDDDRKYPQKESLGPLTGVVGGFTGGELGVQQFVEEGDIKLASKDRRQQSPLIIAGIVAIAGTLGGLFLYRAEEVGEEAVGAVEAGAPQRALEQSEAVLQASAAGLDDTTRLALQVALGAAAVAGLFVGGRAVAKNFATSVVSGATTAATLVTFWAVVAVAFKFVIEN